MTGAIRAILACWATIFVTALIGAATTASAQSWPDRPVKFISSQAAGNATDTIARFVAEQLGNRIGQPVIVENRPGGGNVVGTQAAARSAPDGYTFFFATAAALVTDPYTYKSLPYDPTTAFVPVARVAEVSFLIMANPGVPANNLNELIALAKAEPDRLSIATSGHKRFSGMIVSWINKLAGTRIAQVPYTSMGPGIQDAIAGRVPLVILSVPEGSASLSSGALKPLAVTALERVKNLPNVPTIAETFPGFDFTGWMVLTAISGTPGPIIERVNREMDAILKDPALQERLLKMSFSTPGAGSLQQARDYVNGQHAAWGTLVKEIGLQPE
jgi:tripartite-type tricarboxylate transporter receptor subunit TctC